MNRDEQYMKLALRLARKAESRTSPNPMVGAVVVKNGRIIGKGFHRMCGLAHAEVEALRSAGSRAKGATMYVTLEPCDHTGRTGPCTEAIIKSRIAKVIIAAKDPNPINNGRGTRKLIKNGIKIVTGVLEDEAKKINAVYNKFITKKLPYVTLKIAESLDGKIATRTGDSKWITGEDARRYVHKLRSRVDAVMVGVNTVIKDDPTLASNLPGARQPIRVIVDSRLRTPKKAKIFSSESASGVIIASLNKKDRADLSCRVCVKSLLKKLAELGITSILVEGGGELAASLIEEKLVDKYLFFIAPKIIGGRDAVTSVEGRGIERVSEAFMLKNIKVKSFKKDILIEAEAN